MIDKNLYNQMARIILLHSNKVEVDAISKLIADNITQYDIDWIDLYQNNMSLADCDVDIELMGGYGLVGKIRLKSEWTTDDNGDALNISKLGVKYANLVLCDEYGHDVEYWKPNIKNIVNEILNNLRN